MLLIWYPWSQDTDHEEPTVKPTARETVRAEREWLSVDELADELGVPVRTVYQWRYKGTGPRAATFGRHVRFRRADVDSWAMQRLDEPRVTTGGRVAS